MDSVTRPRRERQAVTRSVCTAPSHYRDEPTGRVRRVEVKQPGSDEWTVEERPEMQKVLVPAQYQDVTAERDIWVIETTAGKGGSAVTERHEFAREQDAANFFTSCQRRGVPT